MTLPMDVKDYGPSHVIETMSSIGRKLFIGYAIASALVLTFLGINRLTTNVYSARVKSWEPGYVVQEGDRCWNLVGDSYDDGEIRLDLVAQLIEKNVRENPRFDCGNLKPGTRMYIPKEKVPVNYFGKELDKKELSDKL